MRQEDFRVGQRVTHRMWRGCELVVLEIVDSPPSVRARTIHTGSLTDSSSDLHAGTVDTYMMLEHMSLLYPSTITLPEGL